jgi:hypothetical protein
VSVTPAVPTTPQEALLGARPAGSLRSLALRALAVCALTGALAAGAAAIFQGGGGEASQAVAPTFTAGAAEIASVPTAEAAAFGVLRRPRTAADAFHEIRAGSGPFGANPALARTAPLPAPSSPLAPQLVSVVPAANGVCLRLLERSSLAHWWCLPMAQAVSGALIVGLLPASPSPRAATSQYLVGLVPNGVSSVEITSVDGAGHKVAVRSNVYATAAFRPVSIAFKLPGRGLVKYRVRI